MAPQRSLNRNNKAWDKEANDIFWLYFNTWTFRQKSGIISYKNENKKNINIKVWKLRIE